VEVEEWLRTGRLASVSVAFSRHGAKEYVQNLLRRDQAWVRTVEEGGAVLLCGSGGMCRAVEAVVRETLEQLRPGLFEQLKKEARLLV
jgi:sulfite reductase alpha subunit-like flavoprotein